jgi:hypothetical protein
VKRLRERQVVGLGIGSHWVECRVVAVNRDEAALAPLGLARRIELPAFRTAASLRFEHGDTPVLLKGEVRRGQAADDLRFAVSDGVQLRQARRAARLRIELPITLGETDTTTLDIAGKGLSARTPGGPAGAPGATLALRLTLPGQDPLRTDALVVRTTPELTAVEFGLLPRAERQRLDAFVYAVQRRVALAA